MTRIVATTSVRSVIVVTAAFLLAGCFGGQQITQIDVGMYREQVIGILGRPDGYRSAGDTEAMTYSNRLMRAGVGGILPTITWCSPMGGCQLMARASCGKLPITCSISCR